MSKFNLFYRDRLSSPVGQGVIAGLTEVCYVALVSVFMVGTQSLLSNPQLNPWLSVFGILAFLSLLVLSAAVSSVLLLGYPLYYFLEHKYREALYAFLGSVITVFIVFAIIFLTVVLSQFA